MESPNGTTESVAIEEDRVVLDAVELAREAAVDLGGTDNVGEHQSAAMESDRLAMHYFECLLPGYHGWSWAVSVARAPRARTATLCDAVLLPGPGALLAPTWVPWSQRLKPGDLGPSDTLPFRADDERLEQGYEATDDEDADSLAIFELGLGRERVLSPLGRDEAATRWYEGDSGPRSPSSLATRGQCSTCGFLIPIGGSLRTVFGVCANEWSPADGRVVSMDHGCGAHSQTDVAYAASEWTASMKVMDDAEIEFSWIERVAEAEEDAPDVDAQEGLREDVEGENTPEVPSDSQEPNKDEDAGE